MNSNNNPDEILAFVHAETAAFCERCKAIREQTGSIPAEIEKEGYAMFARHIVMIEKAHDMRKGLLV